ncbi:unnamed protein product [Owenia fusiformis]|uniref:Uncharacterized protein n=1 Tax=Owenia fusiformis TaxID=6347 RepID=A0A8J1UU58_OWEFU|nr:unnamed protein product [Owenia fusiformis]
MEILSPNLDKSCKPGKIIRKTKKMTKPGKRTVNSMFEFCRFCRVSLFFEPDHFPSFFQYCLFGHPSLGNRIMLHSKFGRRCCIDSTFYRHHIHMLKPFKSFKLLSSKMYLVSIETTIYSLEHALSQIKWFKLYTCMGALTQNSILSPTVKWLGYVVSWVFDFGIDRTRFQFLFFYYHILQALYKKPPTHVPSYPRTWVLTQSLKS